ncbi:MAG TPA: hypothetical protein VE959_08170 [Bryobacteraceae bacterium]|nr:hypothetical protein [Bryobacteraceae bacterium]
MVCDRKLESSPPHTLSGNLYWRSDGGFAGYDKAFHVLTRAHTGAAAGTRSEAANPANAWTFLTFAQWQTGTPLVNGTPLAMNEDPGGTISGIPVSAPVPFPRISCSRTARSRVSITP